MTKTCKTPETAFNMETLANFLQNVQEKTPIYWVGQYGFIEVTYVKPGTQIKFFGESGNSYIHITTEYDDAYGEPFETTRSLLDANVTQNQYNDHALFGNAPDAIKYSNFLRYDVHHNKAVDEHRERCRELFKDIYIDDTIVGLHEADHEADYHWN